MTDGERLYLSPPHMNGGELELVRQAFESKWVAPLGPFVDRFERELSAKVGAAHGAAVASGTAALHLALRCLGVGPGDSVFCSTLTFCAGATPAVHLGARPVFIDSEPSSWNMDPALLEDELDCAERAGRLPKAVVPVHLYGMCADMDRINAACARRGVPVVEDAAEALGASYKGRMAGSLAKASVHSFNGNKIITTSGGGMLVSDDAALVERARFLAAQARDPAPHYQHSEIGYNYRLSNVLAAIGVGQLACLEQRVARRRRVFELYRLGLAGLPGLRFMPEPAWSKGNRWLTSLLIEPREFGADREAVRLALEAGNVESRPVWKPLHLQPAFRGCRAAGGRVAEELFAKGLCLPSGAAITDADVERVCAIVRGCRPGARAHRPMTKGLRGRYRLERPQPL